MLMSEYAGTTDLQVLKSRSQQILRCPICSDIRQQNPLCKVDDFEIFSCTICDADYVFPTPDSEQLKSYYDRKEWFEAGEKGGYQSYDEQTTWSVELLDSILSEFPKNESYSVLDIGCGYGTHLAKAHSNGWNCFGVELSDHAREVAQQRLGDTAYIVGSVSELIPHEFDLVLMLDVIEHLPSPYEMFFQLFSIGAITPKTVIVIATPNSGSIEAKQNPGGWPYRHPPSHLVFYSAKTISYFLNTLHFNNTAISGLHPLANTGEGSNFSFFGGLLVKASGSDFTEFMRERYVPGTWTKIAEYEHLPRYGLARQLARGKKALDFGCGTGYGSFLLAQVAQSVVGLDIDELALTWARDHHRTSNLDFIQSSSLGEELPNSTFDLVTCFEMIEHVDFETQKAAISNIARLLKDDGILLISTPNPEVTKLYGENPYHLREMNEEEFLSLLSAEFQEIRIVKQRVRVSISFDGEEKASLFSSEELESDSTSRLRESLAFIALCSRNKLPEFPNIVFFDDELDFISDLMKKENRLHQSRFQIYQERGRAKGLRHLLETSKRECSKLQESLQIEIDSRIAVKDQYKKADENLHLIARELAIKNIQITSVKFILKQFILILRNKLAGLFGYAS